MDLSKYSTSIRKLLKKSEKMLFDAPFWGLGTKKINFSAVN